VVTAQPDHYKGVYYLGLSLERQNRDDEAIEKFKEANHLQPDFAKAQKKLREYDESVKSQTDSSPYSDKKRMTDFSIPRTDEELETFEERSFEKERSLWWDWWETKPWFAKLSTMAKAVLGLLVFAITLFFFIQVPLMIQDYNDFHEEHSKSIGG
jgi:tetratricopeptide (TPR) repeat protein